MRWRADSSAVSVGHDDALRGVNWSFAQGEDGDVHAKQPVLGRLAMVYADHPDFDARWAS
jgi:hypothetical protein